LPGYNHPFCSEFAVAAFFAEERAVQPETGFICRDTNAGNLLRGKEVLLSSAPERWLTDVQNVAVINSQH